MSGELNQTFEKVWVWHGARPTSRELLRLVFMAGAATALNELCEGLEADGVAGAVMALKMLDAELEQAINKEVVQ